MPRIDIYTRYGRLGASSRLRTIQYFGDEPHKYNIMPLFDDQYISARYDRNVCRLLFVAAGFLKRMWFLSRNRGGRIMIMEKELLPFMPFVFESFFYGDKYLIVDIDDARFHDYDHGVAAYALRRKFPSLFRRANVVLAGNEYIAEYASKNGARKVIIFPTVVDLKKYVPLQRRAPSEVQTIVWIGNPLTQVYLDVVLPVLDEMSANAAFRFRVIGAAKSQELDRAYIEWCPWSEELEARDIAQCDIGIMPLPDRPFERGKCGYKLIQYMASGLPVVASPVGVNRTLVEEGRNGYLCETPEQWKNALEALLSSAELRRSMGLYGRKLVERRYSLKMQKVMYESIISDAISETANHRERRRRGKAGKSRSSPYGPDTQE